MDEVLTVLLGGGGGAHFYLPCLVLGAMTVSLLSPVYSFIAHLEFYRTLALVQSYWLLFVLLKQNSSREPDSLEFAKIAKSHVNHNY